MKSVFSLLLALMWLMSGLLAGCSPEAKRVVNLLPPQCAEKPDPGYCKAAIPKYYFAPEDGVCKQFTWSGCAGIIPFESMERCQQSCLGMARQQPQ